VSPGLPRTTSLVNQDLEDGDFFNHNVEVIEAVGEEVDALRVHEAFAGVPIGDGRKSSRVDGRRSGVDSRGSSDTGVGSRRGTQVGRSQRIRRRGRGRSIAAAGGVVLSRKDLLEPSSLGDKCVHPTTNIEGQARSAGDDSYGGDRGKKNVDKGEMHVG